jgi:hypothetical protein
VERLDDGRGLVNSAFEIAVDAVVGGDAGVLARLLKERPELVRERSSRAHHASLLHYVGANGVEEERQKTPQNIVEIARLLLTAGAEVDAEVDLYGGGVTTLGLAATSVHPERAGVQNELLQVLIDHGADLDRPRAGGNGHGVVIGCLENGRGRAAEFLAGRGARLDLEAAAGVGRLDVVRGFFRGGGDLADGASRAQMQRGFLWACEYGRLDVVEFLLERGTDLKDMADTGESGLHWAVIGGHLSVIQLLLARGALLESRNGYDGTALGQALWSAVNEPEIDYAPVVEFLLKAGAKIEDGTLDWLEKQPVGDAAAKAKIADLLKHAGK